MKRGFGPTPRVKSYARIQQQKRRERETCWWVGWCMIVCTLGGIVLLYAVHQRVKLQALSLLALGGIAGGGGNATLALRGSTKPAATATAATGSSTSSISGQRQQRLQAPRAVSLEEIQARLRLHPFALLLQSQSSPQHPPLEDVLWHMHNHSSCLGKPIFTTMANVGSSLYWQLIENFVYTMGKFGLTDCALMICVSDPHCMQLCQQSLFPCYDYQHQASDGEQRSKVHPMEQIAQLKLFHMPRALQRGVDLFMLDLDVGFLDDPMRLVDKFYSSAAGGQAGGRSRRERERMPGAGAVAGAGAGLVDALVQEDVVFIMNRSVEGWKQWWTEPMPNIGLFLVRGNRRSHDVFSHAWKDYQANTKKAIRSNPGKDQNKVVAAMRSGRWRTGFSWGYLPNTTAVLIDKIFKFEDMAVELGGEAAGGLLAGAVAVHTTCYEQKVKIMGLKAANAYWNPRYYHPQRRTLTKKILYTHPRTVLQEVRALVYLGMRTNRTVIIPNLLAETISDPRLLQAEDKRSNKMQRPMYRNHTLWPGFRVLFIKPLSHNKQSAEPSVAVDIAEPAFYWRVARDYASSADALPEPFVVSFPETASIVAIEKALHLPQNHAQPRVVLHMYPEFFSDVAEVRKMQDDQAAWASDSVGRHADFATELMLDRKLPELDEAAWHPEEEGEQRRLATTVIQNTRLCADILQRMRGNRSCFDKCD